MYLLTYDYEDISRDEVFTAEERDAANQRYRDLRDDPYVSNLICLVMCVGISYNNRHDAKVYTFRTEHYLGIQNVVEPYDAKGNRWIDEYGNPISVYVKTAGYRPAADVKKLAKDLDREDLDVLYTAEDYVANAI